MEAPAEVMQNLQTIQAALEELAGQLQPFLEAGPREVAARLSPLERVHAQLCIAQAACVLLQLTSRLTATKVDSQHPLNKQLERLATYERKAKAVLGSAEAVRSKPGASINIEAANRFIDAAMPDLSTQQKAALRGLSKRGAAAADGGGGGRQAKKQARQEQQQQHEEQPEEQQQQARRPSSAAVAPATAEEFLQDVLGDV